VLPDPTDSALSSWMSGAVSDHPLNQPGIPTWFRDALSDILRSLEDAQPLRLSQKRDAFRKARSVGALLEQRAELLAASLVARAGINFEFAADHPDLVLDGAVAGIEVGTRALDSPRDLHDELELRMGIQRGLLVVLTFDGRPLKLGVERVARIAEDIAGRTYSGPSTTLRFEDAGLTVGVSTGTGFESTQVVLNFGETIGSELTDHLAEVEREIDNKIVEKRRQAKKMPTVLLLDFSRVGVAWLRPGSVWLPVLRNKLPGEPYAGLALMLSTLDSSLPLQLHAVLDPNSPAQLHQALDRVAEVLNLASEP
jgi:hypothetical protein